jgi:ABC-2 type transport system ATP-binding protein
MIVCDSLTKQFGAQTAVSSATFRCEPGTVTGFLGPNGAGKSTTLRMICGLTPPTSGSATIDGRRYSEIPNPARMVGVMLDASAQHPGRTGRETLSLTAATLGLPKADAAAMMERVGLDPSAAKKRVGSYSLGMRQRLGIASAMIGEPQILILDEPANGLDPEGIRWMRTLLREIADAGGTVLVSSHLLSEIQQVADRLLVINQGQIVADGSAAELLAAAPTKTAVSVTATDPHALAAAFEQAGIFWQYGADGTTFQADAEAAAVGAAALAGGVVLTRLEPHGTVALEDLFMSLTRSAAAPPSTGAQS